MFVFKGVNATQEIASLNEKPLKSAHMHTWNSLEDFFQFLEGCVEFILLKV